MKVFAMPRAAAAKATSSFRLRLARCARLALGGLAALNTRIDLGYAQRDRANQNNHTVDGSYWIYLR